MFNLVGQVLEVTLPQGHTMAELNSIAKQELAAMAKHFYGKDIKVNGRCTTALAVLLGHELAPICKSVSIFDPKEDAYVVCVEY